MQQLSKEDLSLLNNPEWVWILEKHFQPTENQWVRFIVGVYRNAGTLIERSQLQNWEKPSQSEEDALYFRANDLDGKSYFTATCLPFQ